MNRLVVLLVLLTAPALTAVAESRFLVRTGDGLNRLLGACQLTGLCSVVRAVDGSLGNLYLVRTVVDLPAIQVTRILRLLANIVSVEPDLSISLGAPAVLSQIPHALLQQVPVDFHGATVWSGYVHQIPAAIIRLAEARAQFGALGRGTVAVIDTGIDGSHPAFGNTVLPGYDFLANRPGANDAEGGVQQSTAAVLDGGQPGLVNSAMAAVLSLPLLSALSGPNYAAYGHGTAVAGVIHMIAPRAQLLPLRAFRPNGTGYLSDVLRGIYYATQNNAQIVNMSFSFVASSAELARAVEYGQQQGVVMVASAGNNNSSAPSYPAALPGVIGVGSTNNFDQRSSFSNYGPSLVWVAAPGEQVVTTYPNGTYAAVSGTSFSAPMVAGTVALLLDRGRPVNQNQARDVLRESIPISVQMGQGRLDVSRALGKWFVSW